MHHCTLIIAQSLHTHMSLHTHVSLHSHCTHHCTPLAHSHTVCMLSACSAHAFHCTHTIAHLLHTDCTLTHHCTQIFAHPLPTCCTLTPHCTHASLHTQCTLTPHCTLLAHSVYAQQMHIIAHTSLHTFVAH